jgi:hypothetical protein
VLCPKSNPEVENKNNITTIYLFITAQFFLLEQEPFNIPKLTLKDKSPNLKTINYLLSANSLKKQKTAKKMPLPKYDNSIYQKYFTDYLVRNPFSLASLRAVEIPFLSIVLIPAAVTFKVIYLSSSGM